MRLPRFDMIFCQAAPAIIVFIDFARVWLLQIGHDEACVWPLRADLDARDDPLDAAPAFRAVVKLLEASYLALLRRGCILGFHAGLEIADVFAQGRRRRDAEDVIEPVDAAKVERFGAAIMTVSAQRDFCPRPVGADGAQQAAQKRLYFLAARPLGGAQHGGDEAALAVEHDDRLKTVFVVMRVEEPQLLAAMHGVKSVVDVEDDPVWNLVEGLAIKIDHSVAHAQQRARVGQVFQPRDRRLRTQFALRWCQIERHLEHRVAAQRVGVVAVLVARRDHQQAKANDVVQRMRDLPGIARILQAGGHALGHTQALLDFTQRQNAAVRRQQAAVEIDDNFLVRNR